MSTPETGPGEDLWSEATLRAVAHEDEASSVPPRRRFVRRFLRQPAGVVALAFLVLLVLVAALAPLVAPENPEIQDLGAILQSPSAGALLGTDDLGRDVLSRLIYGTRVSLTAVALATALAVVLGVPFGLLAGYAGGRVDRLIMTINDAVMSFPGLLLAIAVVAVLGAGLTNAMIAVGIVFAPRMLRLARGATLGVRQETYVEASRSIGTPALSIVRRHVLRNVRSPLLVETALLAGRAMLAEASLSFLGLGAQYPDASWGAMLGRSFAFIDRAPMLLVYPGVAIALTVWAFNVLGDAVRESYGRERRRVS